MEQELWNEDDERMQDDADWDEDHAYEYEEEAAEDWDFYAFQQSSSSFHTVRTRILLTHTQRIGATSYTLRKEKERHPKVGILFFSRKNPKARAKAKEKACQGIFC